jgi:hypothetical protein
VRAPAQEPPVPTDWKDNLLQLLWLQSARSPLALQACQRSVGPFCRPVGPNAPLCCLDAQWHKCN